MSTATQALSLQGVSVRIPTQGGVLHAVNDVNLSVAKGRTTCIVGESGSGKSLTALAVMGLLPRHAVCAGTISLNGMDLANASELAMRRIRGDRISMVFQDPMTSLNPLFAIGTQMVDVVRRHRDVSVAVARSMAKELLTRVGVSDPAGRLEQYPHQQSGGIRQRVLIAMALLCRPDVLIADEPTTALDATVQAQILTLMKELQDEYGMGLLFITHDLGVVARIADDVAVMYAGNIVEFGPAKHVLADPWHPYTQALKACMPMRGVTARRQPLQTIPGSVPHLMSSPRGCTFASRCPHVRDACHTDEAVARHSAIPGHFARCILRAPTAQAVTT